MRLRRPALRLAKLSATAVALAASLALAAPAFAHDGPAPGAVPPPMADGSHAMPDMRPEWRGPQPDGDQHHTQDMAQQQAAYERARADWLTVCRHDQFRNARYDDGRDSGWGGAVVGGLLGGFLGNRIAGRGDRALGTVLGAVGGAAAGAAIDKAGDGARDRSRDQTGERDYCEAYLNAYSQPSYGHGQQMMVPVMMAPMMAHGQPAKQEPCTETTVTEEWVTVPDHNTIIHRPTPDKRIRIAPDKRIRSK